MVGVRRSARALSANWNAKKVGLPGRSQRSGIGTAKFAWGGLALMAKCTTNSRLGQLGTLFCIGRVGDRTDDELLQWFETRHAKAETAFEELVARHGAMILDVCRQVLRDSHDVDDAFQATFLVLLPIRVYPESRRWAAGCTGLHFGLRCGPGPSRSVAARPNGCWLRRRLRILSRTRSNGPKSERLCMRSSIGSPPPTDQRSWRVISKG